MLVLLSVSGDKSAITKMEDCPRVGEHLFFNSTLHIVRGVIWRLGVREWEPVVEVLAEPVNVEPAPSE